MSRLYRGPIPHKLVLFRSFLIDLRYVLIDSRINWHFNKRISGTGPGQITLMLCKSQLNDEFFLPLINNLIKICGTLYAAELTK